MRQETRHTYSEGDKIKILCHNSSTNKNEWLTGVFNHTVAALDRDYRINCTLETGQEIREAAPECVKPFINIKESTYWSIYDFAMSRNRPEMQGTRLQALFKLIELTGEPIETTEPKMNGLKALPIAPGEWVAMKRTAIKDSFYPCKLETFLLTSL